MGSWPKHLMKLAFQNKGWILYRALKACLKTHFLFMFWVFSVPLEGPWNCFLPLFKPVFRQNCMPFTAVTLWLIFSFKCCLVVCLHVWEAEETCCELNDKMKTRGNIFWNDQISFLTSAGSYRVKHYTFVGFILNTEAFNESLEPSIHKKPVNSFQSILQSSNKPFFFSTHFSASQLCVRVKAERWSTWWSCGTF